MKTILIIDVIHTTEFHEIQFSHGYENVIGGQRWNC